MEDLPAPAPIEELLAHREWIRRVARALVIDVDDASDLEQNLWYEMLERPPRTRSSIRGWLARALQRDLLDQRKAEARRRAREEGAARPELVPPDSDLVAEAESHQLAVNAVMALEESYRTTVLLRFFQDLSPADIASRQGIPVETVRSRLKRAMVLLRAALDRGGGGRKGAWALAIFPLLRSPSATTTAAGAATASSAIPFALGGLLMAKMSVAATVALVLLLLAGWLAVDHLAGGGPEPDTRRPSSTEVATAPSSPGAETRAPSLPSPEPAALPDSGPASAAASTTGSLLVTVRWHDGTPAEGVQVEVRPELGRPDPRGSRFGSAQKNGTVLIRELPCGSAWVRADRTEYGRGDRVQVSAAKDPTPCALTIPAGVTVDGLVVDLEDRPVAGAAVSLLTGGQMSGGIRGAATGPDGSFRLRDVEPNTEIGARAPGLAPSAVLRVQGAPGSTQRARLVLRGPGSVVTGRVLDPVGTPVAGALVKVGPNTLLMEFSASGNDGWQLQGVVVETDAKGTFRAEGIRPGTVPLRVVAAGFAPWKGETRVEPGGTADVEIRLGPGATLEGRVLDGEGKPVEKATVTVGDDTGEFHTWALTEGDGTYRIPDLPAGEHRVEAQRIRVGKTRERLAFEAGKSKQWDAHLSTGLTLAGRVVGADGAPLKGWSLTAETSESAERVEDYYAHGCWTDAEGRFRFDNVPDRLLRLYLVAPGTDPKVRVPSLILNGLKGGGEPLEVRVPAENLPSAFLEARILGSGGQASSGAKLQISWGAIGHCSEVFPDPASGRFRAGPLPPRDYDLDLWAGGESSLWSRRVRLEAGRTLDLGELDVDASGGLEMRFRREDGKPVTAVGATLVLADGTLLRKDFHSTPVDGTVRSEPLPPVKWERLPPGRHVLQVEQRAPMPGAAAVEVEVPRDGRAEAVVTIRPAFYRYVRFSGVPGGEPLLSARVTVRDARGVPFAVKNAGRVSEMRPVGIPRELTDSAADACWCPVELPAASWRIEVEGPRGERGSAIVTVDGSDPAVRVIDITLR